MKIAICDDNQLQLNIISGMLDSYLSPDGESVQYDIYYDALNLIASLKEKKYDALLLDILMPGCTGIDAAKEIRDSDKDTPIIFLTSSPEFAVESYRIHAFDYLMKPIDLKDFFDTLDRMCSTRKKHRQNSLLIRTPKAVYSLPYAQIEFLEVNNRTLLFHLSNGSTETITGRLSDYEDTLLRHPQFLKVHRSFIINMDLMKTLGKKSFITLTGNEIPISRNLVQEIHSKYTDYLYQAIRK